MILVDTSVWIDYFNGTENRFTNTLDSALIEGTVAIGDLIFLEILQGFKRDKDFRQAKTTLATLDQYEMFGHKMALQCAENYRALRKKGITIRRTTDVIIATFCIENQLPLLFSDRDFIPFVESLGLIAAVLKHSGTVRGQSPFLSMSENQLREIRDFLQSGTPLGNKRFWEEVEAAVTTRVGYVRRGRPCSDPEKGL